MGQPTETPSAPWQLGVGLVALGLLFIFGGRAIQRDIRRTRLGRWAEPRVRGMAADDSGRNLESRPIGAFLVLLGLLVVVAAFA